MGDFWSASFFFFEQPGGQDIFFPPKCSAGYFFFSPHFSAGFFFAQKSVVFTFTECIYIYIVVIAVIGLIWSCKALNVVSYTKSFLYSYVFGMSFFRII